MDHMYPGSHPYGNYENVQWSEDTKQSFLIDENGNEDRHHEEPSNSSRLTGSESDVNAGEPTSLKTEDEFSSLEQVWHDRPQDHQPNPRHYSHPQISTMNVHAHHPNLASVFQHPHHWSVPHSGSSTPTPIYGTVDHYGQHVSYGTATPTFAAYSQEHPISAISMSPQSSQGGWASNTSSDGTDQRGIIQSPSCRPTSPTTVVRSDGIRKKNARFEIPKERNLANIDAMILASTDESEKKELKQQKRLLRNRQAALDSRQRKKTHTEKLEQEKKVSEKKMYDLEEACARLETQLNIEREQWLQERQQLVHDLQAISYDRDEAIRSKTQETGELRRQNNMLKDCIRDLERNQHRGLVTPCDSNGYHEEYHDFSLQGGWDDEFGLIDGDDFAMNEQDHSRVQTTPRPTAQATTADSKLDHGFTWNTFYITDVTTSAIASSISPAEAGNVLKAVLKSGADPESKGGQTALLPSKILSEGQRVTHTSLLDVGPSRTTNSALDNLHQTLSTPSRRQEIAAAFAMSASTYNHITDPFNEHLNHDVNNVLLEPSKPSQLEQAFASMQAEKDEIDRMTGVGSKIRERSLLWDSIPPQVIKDFEELVRRNGQMPRSLNEDKMED